MATYTTTADNTWVIQHGTNTGDVYYTPAAKPKLGGTMQRIQSFSGDYLFLSNFYPYMNGPELMPGGEEMLGRQAGVLWGYPTNENFYQAMKCTDEEYREKLKTCTAGQAKKFGSAKGMAAAGLKLRDDWENIKLRVMKTGLEQKFSIPELMEALIDTGGATLTEGNTWHDNYWGFCHCDRCAEKEHFNQLGNMLYRLRNELR